MPIDPSQSAEQHPLDGLRRVILGRYRHAYGRAWDIPKLLRQLASASSEERNKALHALYGNIWHQGTVSEAAAPTVPFLIRLAAWPAQGDRPAIIQYLAALATGRSYLDVHSRHDTFGLANQPGFTENLARELEWVHNAHEAVAKGLSLYVEWMADRDPAVRSAVPFLLAVLPECASETIPEIRKHLPVEANGDARASLVRALGVLAGSAADPELRLALADSDPLVRVAAATSLACHRTDNLQVRDILLQAMAEPELIAERWDRLPWCDEGARGDVERCLALLQMAPEPMLTQLVAAVETNASYPAPSTAGTMLRLAFQNRPAPAVPFAELSATQQRVVRILAVRICRRFDETRIVFGNMNDEFKALGLPGHPEELRAYVGLPKPDRFVQRPDWPSLLPRSWWSRLWASLTRR